MIPILDATNGNEPVATITVDEFTLHALIGCTASTAQNPRVRDALGRLLGETARPFPTDAGHWCRECGRVVSWLDHLPPAEPGGAVQCFAGRLDEALEAVRA